MKILFSRGSFCWDGKTTHTGLICMCHFNTNDTHKKINTAIVEIQHRRHKLKKQTVYEDVILVPFSCLDTEEHTMDYDRAYDLFIALIKGISNPIVVSFSITNKFLMNLPVNPYTKFISI